MPDGTEAEITVLSSITITRGLDNEGDDCVFVKSSQNVTLMEMLGLLEMGKVYVIREFTGS